MTHPTPIFFAVTRSFWAALALFAVLIDMLIVAIEQDPEATSLIAGAIAGAIGLPAETVEPILRVVAPAVGLFIAQQRMGSARPYTTQINAETVR